MLASSSRHVLINHSRLSRVVLNAVSEGGLLSVGRKFSSNEGTFIPVEDTPTPVRSRKRQPIRNGPWQFTPDHSYQSVHHKSAIARFQLTVSEHAERGAFIDCLRTCKKMKEEGVKPTLLVYNALLLAAAKNHLHMEAEGILDDMVAMGVRPDLQSYHYLIQAYRPLEAIHMWSILDRVQELGLIPNAQTFTLMLERPLHAENLEMAVQGMNDMVDRHIVPELGIAQSTIHLACKLGYPRLALELAEVFESMSVRRLDTEVWVNCLMSSAENLYAEGTLFAWNKVADMGVVLDEGLCIEVLHTVARNGLPDLGNEVLRALKAIGAPLAEHHLAPLIEAFCKSGRLQEAFEMLPLMRQQGIKPTTETGHPIFEHIKGSIDAIDATWAILDELRDGGKAVDVVALNALVQASVYLGDIQRAIGAYKAFEEYNQKPNVDTYNLLLSACISVGHRSLGDRLLGEMKAAGIKPNVRTYERLILLCLTQPMYEDAFFYLEEMKANSLLPTLTVYDAIVKKCVSVGDGRYKLALEEMGQCGYAVSRALQEFIKTGGLDQPPSTVSSGLQQKEIEGEKEVVPEPSQTQSS